MKFVKDNLIPLICGAVVLLALATWYFYFVPKETQLQSDMTERHNQAGMITGLIAPVSIPGTDPVITAKTLEDNVIKAYAEAQGNMHHQYEAISKLASERNHEHRLREIKDAKGNVTKTIPLLANDPMDYYLPKIDPHKAARYGFKTAYGALPKLWERELVSNALIIPPPQGASPAVVAAFNTTVNAIPLGQPPTDDEVRRALDAENAKARLAPGGASVTQDPREIMETTRRIISNRAAAIHCYVDIGAFQQQPWAALTIPPNEPQIFEALIESWCQQDVVNAILDVNKKSSDVGQSPVKRLEKIIVGGTPGMTAAQPTPGAAGVSNGASLFIVSGPPGAVGATPPLAGSPPGMDLGRTMTGRIGSTDYDVTLLTIVIDLDPAYQNRFIEALYKQNNGYTVINIKTTTSDPLEAASKGYLYGNVQVVHLEIQLEGLLFRTWTAPLMPDLTKTTLGVIPGAPGAPAAPAAVPAGGGGA